MFLNSFALASEDLLIHIGLGKRKRVKSILFSSNLSTFQTEKGVVHDS